MDREPTDDELRTVLRALIDAFEELGPLRPLNAGDVTERTGMTNDEAEQALQILARNRLIDRPRVEGVLMVTRVTEAGTVFASES